MSEDSEAMKLNRLLAGSRLRVASISKNVLCLEMDDGEKLVTRFTSVRWYGADGYHENIATREHLCSTCSNMVKDGHWDTCYACDLAEMTKSHDGDEERAKRMLKVMGRKPR